MITVSLFIISLYLLNVQTSLESNDLLSDTWASLLTHKPNLTWAPEWANARWVTPRKARHVSWCIYCPLNPILFLSICLLCVKLETWQLYLIDSLAIASLGSITERHAWFRKWKRSRHHCSFHKVGALWTSGESS